MRAHTTSILMTSQSERSFSGAKFNNTSKNNWKSLFEVNFSKNSTKTIRLFICIYTFIFLSDGPFTCRSLTPEYWRLSKWNKSKSKPTQVRFADLFFFFNLFISKLIFPWHAHELHVCFHDSNSFCSRLSNIPSSTSQSDREFTFSYSTLTWYLHDLRVLFDLLTVAFDCVAVWGFHFLLRVLTPDLFRLQNGRLVYCAAWKSYCWKYAPEKQWKRKNTSSEWCFRNCHSKWRSALNQELKGDAEKDLGISKSRNSAV